MDNSERKITKIARNAQQFTSLALKNTGLGVAEYEFIHFVRHHPGSTQSLLCEKLHLDKAAIARRSANLQKKGYIYTIVDPIDSRSKQLYATDLANDVKDSKSETETLFYSWLLEGLNPEESTFFIELLNRLYLKSKTERKNDFKTLLKYYEEN